MPLAARTDLALAILLTAAGMWLLLPRGRARGRRPGAVLGLAAWACWVSRLPRLGDLARRDRCFTCSAGVTIVSAVAAVTFRNPVYCAMWFGMTLLGTAGLFFSRAPSFWPWPRWSSMPARSWSRSCSC